MQLSDTQAYPYPDLPLLQTWRWTPRKLKRIALHRGNVMSMAAAESLCSIDKQFISTSSSELGGGSEPCRHALCCLPPQLHQMMAVAVSVTNSNCRAVRAGLVVGSLEAGGDSFAVVQRPNAEWDVLPRGTIFDFTLNGRPISRDVSVVSSQGDVDRVWRQSGGKRVRALALTEDDAALMALCQRATSFSCSLGPAMRQVLLPLLSRLPPGAAGERPVLYACENDHAGAKAMGARLAKQLDVCCCMVDRICTDRTIGNGVVDVSAEEGFAGSLVLLETPAEGARVPFGGPTVLVPHCAQEAKYFYDRKFLSPHQHVHAHDLNVSVVQAFMTLRQHGTGNHKLETYGSADAALRAQMWAWASVRCLMLLQEYGLETVKVIHGVMHEVVSCKLALVDAHLALDALLTFAWQTLGRFSGVDDTTGRVLGGGVGNRWAGRLWPVLHFLRWRGGLAGLNNATSAGARLMRRAGVPAALAAQCCEDLVKDGLQFCAAEMKEAVASLVAFYKNTQASETQAPALVADSESLQPAAEAIVV
ncbi:hypothetical protein JKP88DRAFT_247989 [Tribonema minus]|uniref:Uncharacterized protein n=1 Tax=Tribonema minus TaxID=303371 RepID=A0A836CAW0_9STRA|nr:hypothetical protein JKP88DRAFT_247989 [Tribonema minus]